MLAAGGLVAPALLEACAPAVPSNTATSSSANSAKPSGGVMPTYVPFPNKPQPDYPSSGDPYMDGYDNYPKNPQRVITGDVGGGSTVQSMTIGLFPPPTP
jgi:hypothetical protein